MTRFGYTLMTEQAGPKDLVRFAVGAEEAGFDFEVSSDHFSPWLSAQGHAPYAWTVLGAVAHATERVELMTYVTSPILRYTPAVVAQKSATLQLLADGRFTLGLGTGESLNEHVAGHGWPGVEQRQDMLVEAIEIIRALHTGELVTYDGQYFRVDTARIWDLPEGGVPLAAAVSGPKSIAHLAPLVDHFISTEPEEGLISGWEDARAAAGITAPSRKIGQIPLSWDADRDAAVARAHEQFRWFGLGWSVNADLPTTAGFAAASAYVRPEDVAESIPCGDDVDAVVEAVSAYWEAGYTDIALVQIGGDVQEPFLRAAQERLLPALREAAPAS